jgi:hypothetical protein
MFTLISRKKILLQIYTRIVVRRASGKGESGRWSFGYIFEFGFKNCYKTHKYNFNLTLFAISFIYVQI